MASTPRIDRRAFLLQCRPPRRLVELSCERLYMNYLDARSDGRVREFLEALERELETADEVRLTDRAWLARDDFRAHIEPLLRAVPAVGVPTMTPVERPGRSDNLTKEIV